MNDPEKVRITVTVDKSASDKIAELAERMGASHSKMASMLLEAGISDNEWMIKVMTTSFAKGLMKVLGLEYKTTEELISKELNSQLGAQNDAKGIAEWAMDRPT